MTVVKILDFGLANFANDVAAEELGSESAASTIPGVSIVQQLTQMGTMMGTPDYIAPEQAENAHTADIRSDIYSLGCTFYTLLTGKTPFGEGSVLEKIKAHIERDAAPVSEFRDDVQAEVEAVVRKMMAKDPAQRYQTPAEAATALAPFARRLAEPVEKTTRKEVPSQPGRRLGPLSIAAALFIAALVAAVVFYIQTDYGVVRVEVMDESLEVKLNGKTISMKDGDTPLSIRAGARTLVVRRGNFEFETDGFQLRRRGDVALKVELLAGEVVVSKDGQRFAARPLPPVVLAQRGTAFFLDNRSVAPEDVPLRLQEIFKQAPDREIVLECRTEVRPLLELTVETARAAARRITRPASAVTESDELKRLEGRWRAVSLELDGKTPTVRLPGLEITVADGKIAFYDHANADPGHIDLQPAATPKQLDVYISRQLTLAERA
jgi:hypothetical protein